jgi:hypothetical protein
MVPTPISSFTHQTILQDEAIAHQGYCTECVGIFADLSRFCRLHLLVLLDRQRCDA